MRLERQSGSVMEEKVHDLTGLILILLKILENS